MPSLHLSEHRDGDEKKTKENKPDRPLKPSLEPLLLPTAASKGITSARDGESRFARALASGDASTRLRALDALVAWLFAKGNCSAAANSVTRDDMRKLWKGMFYSYWHSDLALVQKQLATRMAGIAGELQPELSALYLDAFYETLAREWAGLDRLRLDKFMLLVRCFVEATFSLAAGTKSASASASSASSSAAVASASSPWSPKRVERLLMPLSEAMCPPPDAPLLLSGSGLGLHLADVAAGELLRAVAASSSSSSSAAASSSSPFQEGILAAVLPFSRAAASTQRPELGNRLAREFFSKIVAAIGAGREEEEEEEEEGASSKKKTSLLCPSLAVPLSKQLLSLASLPETRARNREVLYAAAAEMEAVAEKAKKEKKAQAKKEAVVVKEVSPEKGQQQQQQQQREKHANSKRKKRPAAAEAAAPPTPPTAVPSKAAEQAAAAGAAAPEAKKAKTAAAATTATATPAPPPPTAAAVSAERGGGVGEEEARKAEKRVRWSFKSNLAHAVGGPVPPPHVRTPPGSAPRGSALKVKGAGVTTRRAAAAAAKAEAAEAEKGVGSKKGSNNNRARADAFF